MSHVLVQLVVKLVGVGLAHKQFRLQCLPEHIEERTVSGKLFQTEVLCSTSN